jgi:predicted secreted protein
MGYKLGSEIAIKWNDKLLLGKLSAGFEGSTDSVDVTNDTSAGWKESLPGDKGGSVSFSAVYDPEATTGQGCDDLEADWIAGTVRTLAYGGTTTGDKIITASAYITKFSRSGSHGDKATCDVTFQITGPITPGTVAA